MELIYTVLAAGFSLTAAIAIFFSGVVGAVAIGLLKDEASAWLPKLTSSIVSLAVMRMKEGDRTRYAEEWSSHILQYPGKLSQVYQALKFLLAGRRLAGGGSVKKTLSIVATELWPMLIGLALGALAKYVPETRWYIWMGIFLMVALIVLMLGYIRMKFPNWKLFWAEAKKVLIPWG